VNLSRNIFNGYGRCTKKRIIKSEQGVNNFFLPKRFIFIFVSFLFVSGLFRFVSVSDEYRFVSFRFMNLKFIFRFVSFQEIMRFLRFVPFRFVSFLNPVKIWYFKFLSILLNWIELVYWPFWPIGWQSHSILLSLWGHEIHSNLFSPKLREMSPFSAQPKLR
jgi:hypothetical protein